MSKFNEPWSVKRETNRRAFAENVVLAPTGEPLAMTMCDSSEPYLGVAHAFAPAEARADRIVACVNALAGVSDPAAFVACAREAFALLERHGCAWHHECDDAHRVPPCEACALRARARAAGPVSK